MKCHEDRSDRNRRRISMIRIVSLGTLRAATARQELGPCSVKMIQGARSVSYFMLFQVAPSQVSTCFDMFRHVLSSSQQSGRMVPTSWERRSPWWTSHYSPSGSDFFGSEVTTEVTGRAVQALYN